MKSTINNAATIVRNAILAMYSAFAMLYAANALAANYWVGHDLNGAPCQALTQGFGPYDYTNPEHRGHKLYIVESVHFTKEVESLQKGSTTTGSAGGDISYTLRAFPNHHRALYAMMRFQIKASNRTDIEYNFPPVECYFQRAIAFKPDDYRAMQLYANYLIKKDKPKMAVDIYKQALKVNNPPPQINYSLGLLYIDLKEYDKAVEQAKIAYGSGLKKTKLARKLKAINRWPVAE